MYEYAPEQSQYWTHPTHDSLALGPTRSTLAKSSTFRWRLLCVATTLMLVGDYLQAHGSTCHSNEQSLVVNSIYSSLLYCNNGTGPQGPQTRYKEYTIPPLVQSNTMVRACRAAFHCLSCTDFTPIGLWLSFYTDYLSVAIMMNDLPTYLEHALSE